MFTWKTHCGLKVHFGQFDRSEICTEVSFTPPEVMWTLIMKLPHTEVKSQTGLSSLRVSCKCALNDDFLITQVLVHSYICRFCNITFCIYCLLRSIKSFHILLKHNSFLKHDNFTNWSNTLGIFCCGLMGKSGSDWLSTGFFFVQCSIDDDLYTSKQISAWWLVYFKLTFKVFLRNQLSVRQRHLFIIWNMLLQLRFQCLWDHFIVINFSSNGKPLILNCYGKNHPGDKSMDRGSDPPQNPPSTPAQHADDTTMHDSRKNGEIKSCAQNLEKDLNNLSPWSTNENPLFNEDKTKSILSSTSQLVQKHQLSDSNTYQIKCNEKAVWRVQCTKLLGIHFDENLSWKDHVNNVMLWHFTNSETV